MKFSSTIIGAALLATGVSAEVAVVINHCSSTVYVQSFPYDGSAPGLLTSLGPGGTWVEEYRRSGSTIKLATNRGLTSPLFFGYSFSTNPNIAYYELSTEWGNPFSNSHNILSPGNGCQAFDCAAGQADCYSTPAHKKVYSCPEPLDLILTLCA